MNEKMPDKESEALNSGSQQDDASFAQLYKEFSALMKPEDRGEQPAAEKPGVVQPVREMSTEPRFEMRRFILSAIAVVALGATSIIALDAYFKRTALSRDRAVSRSNCLLEEKQRLSQTLLIENKQLEEKIKQQLKELKNITPLYEKEAAANRELRESNSSWAGAAKQKDEQIAGLRAKVQEQAGVIAEQGAKLARAEKDASGYQAALKEKEGLATSYGNASKKVNGLEAAAIQLIGSNNALKAENEKLAAEKKRLEEETGRQKQDILTLQKRMQSANQGIAQIRALQKTIGEQEAKIEQYRRQAEGYDAEKESLQKRIQEAEAERQRHDTLVSKLEAEKIVLEARAKYAERGELLKKLQGAEAESKRLEAQVSKLEADKIMLRDMTNYYGKEIDRMRKEAAEAEAKRLKAGASDKAYPFTPHGSAVTSQFAPQATGSVVAEPHVYDKNRQEETEKGGKLKAFWNRIKIGGN